MYKTQGYDALEWAMHDIVNEKIRNYIEEDHVLGSLFFERIKKWYLFKTKYINHDEL